MIEEKLYIQSGQVELEARLLVPPQAKVIVLIPQTPSGRLQNHLHLASIFEKRKYGSLVFDLLTEYEEQDHSIRFNIQLLTDRLLSAYRWLKRQEEIGDMKMVFSGTDTSAASALKAAAQSGTEIAAVISCAGRSDLAVKDLDGAYALAFISRRRTPCSCGS